MIHADAAFERASRQYMGATISRHEPVGENHWSDNFIILVLVLLPFLLWSFWWKRRIWWIKSRGSKVPW